MTVVIVVGVLVGVFAGFIGFKGLFEGKDPSTAAVFIGVGALCVGIALLLLGDALGVLLIVAALLLFAAASSKVRAYVFGELLGRRVQR